jgi:hypothetical protein
MQHVKHRFVKLADALNPIACLSPHSYFPLTLAERAYSRSTSSAVLWWTMPTRTAPPESSRPSRFIIFERY